MSLSANIISTEIAGKTRSVIADVTFDTSYVTGGELFPPSMVGLYRIDSVSADAPGLDASHAFVVAWNKLQGALSTLKAFWGDNANVASAQLIEVTSTTNLAAVVVRVTVRGA